MKIRIKFTKTGSLRFIGHLDVMRYFQKAFRRAKVDIAYSQGFSPHQILSFAAPLGIGLTSEGEYLDAEFHTTKSSKEMIEIINQCMVEEIQIREFKLLDDNAANAMSSVAAADYVVTIKEEYYDETFFNQLEEFGKQSVISIVKKTKRSEKEMDIKPMIYELRKEGENSVFMKVATGSVENLKPELVMKAYCDFCEKEWKQFGFMTKRLETYLFDEEKGYLPLGAIGEDI
ncbi:MAG: TIGR03936 family radical SAM-associated protein [Lachnospiraceae bacterium]|nr:DUF2344 domain-containing protein [Lachnospiraceae bacterium]MEE1341815.1 TIGR03936 family radical SAM-associated protein [Lachnospiraceae bacterium]